MSETTVLHIQADDSSATRVMELPGVSVRVGRGSQCEVRLAEPTLAEVQCMLRRRGEAWHIQPVGPPGRISIAGRPVDYQRPWPPGTPLRVGDHLLTLRPSDGVPAGLGTYTSPIPVDPGQGTDRVEVVSPPEEPGEPSPHAGTSPSGPLLEAERDRLLRWQERLEQRERWLKARQEERRWEARWKAAGENLRSRTRTGSTGRPAADAPRTPRPEPVRRPASPPAPEDEVRRPPRPAPEPSRPFGAQAGPAAVSSPSTRPVGEPVASRPTAGSSPVDASSGLSASAAAPEASKAEVPLSRSTAIVKDGPVLGGPREETRSLGRDRSSNPSSSGSLSDEIQVAGPDEPDPRPTPDRSEAEPARLERPAGRIRVDGPETTAESGPAGLRRHHQSGVELTAADAEGGPGASARSTTRRRIPGVEWCDVEVGGPEQPDRPVLEPAAPEGARAEIIDPTRRPKPAQAHPEARRPASLGRSEEVVASPVRDRAEPRPSGVRFDPASLLGPAFDRWPTPPPYGSPGSVLDPPVEAPGRSEVGPSPEWPSARAILASRPPRPCRKAQGRPTAGRPAPTVAREPKHWIVPFWLAWLPAAFFASIVGAGGLALGWTWAQDDYAAGLLANRLLADDPPEGAGDPEEEIDLEGSLDATWWRTSAGHLFLRALALDRAGSDPETADQVRFLLQAARNASPVQASVRFALAHRLRGEGRGPALVESLGLSRDVVALAWAGGRLLEAGRAEAASRAYGEALEMASRADLASLDPPAFREDPHGRRFALPHEGLMQGVVVDMVGHDEWTYAQWSTALPAFAVAPLAANRALKARGRTGEAEEALDLALTRAQEPTPPGCSGAVHLAAEAEALALRGRWREAEERYRSAIDQMPHDTFRRSWYMNLADLYVRLGDDAGRRNAWEAAKGPDPDEEITRRAIRDQEQAGLDIGAAGRRGLRADRRPAGDREADVPARVRDGVEARLISSRIPR